MEPHLILLKPAPDESMQGPGDPYVPSAGDVVELRTTSRILEVRVTAQATEETLSGVLVVLRNADRHDRSDPYRGVGGVRRGNPVEFSATEVWQCLERYDAGSAEH